MLLICVYTPSSSSSSLFNEYLNTLGKLDGFIHSNQSDVVVIVGDFNVDFDQCNQITSLLSDFMSDHGLCSCDLLFRDDVQFTYEHDDGLSRSWIDHVISSQSFSNRISDVRAMHSGYVLSDHSPLPFSIKSDLSPTPITKPVSSANQCRIDWARVSNSNIHKYCYLVSERITSLQSDVVVCSLSNCSAHHSVLDSYGSHLISTLLSCAYECFPTRSNQSFSRLKESSLFWHKIWKEAGYPSSGVLSQIKKNVTRRYRYAVRCLIRRQIIYFKRNLQLPFPERISHHSGLI